MKLRFIKICLMLIAAESRVSAQKNFVQGQKPQIAINGGICAIMNQQFSCTPRTCNSVAIDEGDSISFCTHDLINLAIDTAYYMQWNFNGSNYPSPIFNYFPTSTPVCYYPKWNTPGHYVVDIYYNGWLSAYSWGECYSYGPSHWIINVTVLALNTSTQEVSGSFKIITYPNPAT